MGKVKTKKPRGNIMNTFIIYPSAGMVDSGGGRGILIFLV